MEEKLLQEIEIMDMAQREHREESVISATVS